LRLFCWHFFQTASFWCHSYLRQCWTTVCVWCRRRLQPRPSNRCHCTCISPHVYVTCYLCNGCSPVPTCCQGNCTL